MIDSRLEGRDKQAAANDQVAYADTNRTILGATQMQWLKDELSSSAAKWKIIGNQVMFAPLTLAGIPLSYEQWDGYQADRNRIIDHVMDNNINNVMVITGDIHTSWANDVPVKGQNYNPNTGADSAFVEFIGPSITTGANINVPTSAIMFSNPHIKYVELTQDGYFTLDIDENRAQADWNYVSSIFDSNFTTTQPAHWQVKNNERFLSIANSGVSGFENTAPFAPLNPNVANSIARPLAVKPFQLLNVYPTPFQNELNIEWYSVNEKEYKLALMAADGSQTDYGPFKSHTGNNKITIPLQPLASGNYYLLVKDGKEIIQKKLVVKTW